MNPVVVIPTFIYPRRHRGGADVVSSVCGDGLRGHLAAGPDLVSLDCPAAVGGGRGSGVLGLRGGSFASLEHSAVQQRLRQVSSFPVHKRLRGIFRGAVCGIANHRGCVFCQPSVAFVFL